MKAEDLRKSILQLAIQGKLVPQDPNDEPASVLLGRIRAEKQKLIKEGKIKKDKGDSIIFKGDDNRHYEKFADGTVKCIEDEIDFDLPEGWEWSRISNFSVIIFSGKSPKYSKTPTRHKVIGQQANQWEGIDFRYIKYCTNEFSCNMPDLYFLQDGDVLLNTLGNGTLGRSGIFYNILDTEKILTDGHLFVFRNLNAVLSKYLLINLRTKYDKIVKSANGSTNQTFLNLNKTLQWLIPVPPFKEIERIVFELDTFEPFLHEYDLLEKSKSKLDDEIYDNLKKSILQYAIQGKLVPQDPNDKPASVLLARIRAEKKAQLGKKYVESYIYKGDDNCYYEKVGKNEPILLEDLPFDVPDSWSWARLKDAVEINPRNTLSDDTIVSFIEMKSLGGGFSNSFIYEKRAWKNVKNGFTHFRSGDVGFAKITPCFQNRKSAIFSELENGYGAGTTELHILRPYKNTILADYLLWFIKSPYFIEYGKQKFSGTAGQQRFGTDEVKNTLIPIPPQVEQERICLKIKKMLQCIEKDES